MSKRKVNLFSGPLHEINKKFDRYRYVRNTTIVLSVVFFAAIIVAYLVQSKFTGDLLTAQAEKEAYQQAIEVAKARQTELHGIAVRLRLLKDALNKDISFASQSARLLSLLDESQSQAFPTEIAFRNKTDFQTALSFSSQEDLLRFIKASETNDFRKNFKNISVGEFSISAATSSAKQQTLEFSGSFL